MIFRLPGMPGIQWHGFDSRKPEHCQRVVARLNEYMAAPATLRERVTARVQELTSKDATPDMFNNVNVVDMIQTDLYELDLGWQQAFRFVDLRQTFESSFEILDVSSGLTFQKVKAGENVRIYRVAGEKQTVSIDRYGGGLGFDLEWWMDNKFYHVEEAAADFRAKYYQEQAETFYALIEAVETEESYDTDLVTTISNGVATLLSNLHGSLPASAASTFLLYFAPKLQKAVFAALNDVLSYTKERQMRFNVVPVMSQNVSTTNKLWLVLPGRKNAWANRMDLTLWGDTNIHNFTHDIVGWGRYAGYLNSSQVLRIATS